MTPEEFNKVNALISATVHKLALDSAGRWFGGGGTILDLGCATAPVSSKLWATGSFAALTLVDENIGFLRAAKARCPGARALWGDMLAMRLPQAHFCLWTNVSGFFSAAQLFGILRRLPAGIVVANFLVKQDQPEEGPVSVTLDRGPDDLTLYPVDEHDLGLIIRNSGYSVVETTHYVDTKPERVLVLRRD